MTTLDQVMKDAAELNLDPAQYGTLEDFEAAVRAAKTPEWLRSLQQAAVQPATPSIAEELTWIERLLPDTFESFLDKLWPDWRDNLPQEFLQSITTFLIAKRAFTEPTEARRIAKEEVEATLKKLNIPEQIAKATDVAFKAGQTWATQQGFLTKATLNNAVRELGYVTQAQVPDTTTMMNVVIALIQYLAEAETDSKSKRWLLDVLDKLQTPPRGSK